MNAELVAQLAEIMRLCRVYGLNLGQIWHDAEMIDIQSTEGEV
jgi:hypothetical protein